MSNKNTYTPPNTTLEIPLISLKGNPYMKVAYRLQWLTVAEKSYTTEVQLLERTESAALALVTVTTYNENGSIVRRVQDLKREEKKDFNDFTEKAVTGALGRALAQLGYGTAQAIADLDEGTRIVDAPIAEKTISSPEAVAASVKSTTKPATKSTWKAPAAKAVPKVEAAPDANIFPIAKTANGADDGWGD